MGTQSRWQNIRGVLAFGALISLLVVIVGCRSGDGGSDAGGRAPATGKIAFVSDREGNGEIYTMNADGTGQTNLTNNPASDDHPAWSPDGSKIAFSSYRDGNPEIYVMNADGSGVTRLTNHLFPDRNPAWSPDGLRIAFVSHRASIYTNPEVYVMNADGSNVTRLTHNGGDPENPAAYDGQPAWSPDGTRIAFQSKRDYNFEIYIMNSDGSGQTNLTNNPAHDGDPAWSPDGTRIAFVSNRDGNAEIYVMNADGSGLIRLTHDPATDRFPPADLFPTWSPDGTRIAFVSDRDQVILNDEIYIMNADGSGQTRVTDNPAHDSGPGWSADGSQPE